MTFILYLPRLDLLPVVVESCKLDSSLGSPMANSFLVRVPLVQRPGYSPNQVFIVIDSTILSD